MTGIGFNFSALDTNTASSTGMFNFAALTRTLHRSSEPSITARRLATCRRHRRIGPPRAGMRECCRLQWIIGYVHSMISMLYRYQCDHRSAANCESLRNFFGADISHRYWSWCQHRALSTYLKYPAPSSGQASRVWCMACGGLLALGATPSPKHRLRPPQLINVNKRAGHAPWPARFVLGKHRVYAHRLLANALRVLWTLGRPPTNPPGVMNPASSPSPAGLALDRPARSDVPQASAGSAGGDARADSNRQAVSPFDFQCQSFTG